MNLVYSETNPGENTEQHELTLTMGALWKILKKINQMGMRGKEIKRIEISSNNDITVSSKSGYIVNEIDGEQDFAVTLVANIVTERSPNEESS